MTEAKKNRNGNGKVAIIGAGYVGAQVTYAITMRNVANEIALVDINKEKALGESKDIRHGLPFMDTTRIYVGDYSDCADADLIIISAGRGRKPGETRLDLTSENLAIMKSVTSEIKKHNPKGVVMIISNPVDILTLNAAKWLDLPEGRVFGTGCILDTSRFLRTVADCLDLDISRLDGYVIGTHGEYPVPVWSSLTVDGMPIQEFCNEAGLPWNDDIKSEISGATQRLGAEIIAAKGRTDFGIATCVCRLTDAIINDRPIETPVSSPLHNEYDTDDVALSVPSVIGSFGVKKIAGVTWSKDEHDDFLKASDALKATLNALR